MEIHSSIPAWRIPMDRGACRATVHGVARVGHDFTFTFTFRFSCIGEGNGNPLQCSCLENPMGRADLWATIHGVTESDTTEQLRKTKTADTQLTVHT